MTAVGQARITNSPLEDDQAILRKVEKHLNQQPQATTGKFYSYSQHLLTSVGLFSTPANKIVEQYAISSCCSRGAVHQP